jgi:sugar-specific transcriptional regulator TrmB
MDGDKTTRDAYEALMATGFSDYEARCYCAMVMQSPANGYQIARVSGVPRAKVYECLERLVARGAAVRVESGEAKGRLFAAIDPGELIDRFVEGALDSGRRAREALERLRAGRGTVEVLWRVASRADLIDRGRRMIADAGETLHLALWAEEFDALLAGLVEAAGRGVSMGLILYGPHDGIGELQSLGAGAILHSRNKLQAVPVMGKQFVVVQDRQKCIVGSIFPNDSVEGVYTLNRGLVINAADLVNHEIYLERILREVGPPVLDTYGENLDGLDAFEPPRRAVQARPTGSGE